jgi:hypothetical protein
MNDSGSWWVTFAGEAVAIEWQHEKAAAILRFLFGASKITGKKSIHTSFRIDYDPASREFKVHQNKGILYRGIQAGQAALLLHDFVLGVLAGACQKGPVVHAGAVVSQKDFGVLLPGKSGMGKTTLTGWLIRSGYGYLTDELVCLEAGTVRITGFYRPLHFKLNAYNLFALGKNTESAETTQASKQTFPTSLGTLVHPSFLNQETLWKNPLLRLIIFPQFEPNAGCRLTPLSLGRACARLMETVVNARNFPDHGFADTARICRQTPAYSLGYGDIKEAEKKISGIVRELHKTLSLETV